MNKLILLTLVLIMSCKKDNENTYGSVTFYQNTNNHNPELYLNGKNLGLLKRISNVPICGINEKDIVISIDVTTGKHFVQLKDTLGVVTSKYINVYEGCQLIAVR